MKFGDNKFYTWPWVKTIVNPRQQPQVVYFFHSKPYLGRSKEPNNQHKKYRSREHLNGISFCHTQTHAHTHIHTQTHQQTSSTWNFSDPRVLFCSRCLIFPNKINTPLFCYPIFFNHQVRIKKMPNKIVTS